jgi:Flp pilus assembly protein TadB
VKERILNYRNRIDNLIGANSEETDWGAVIDEHLVQIGFFQHERLIHWLVTMLFAILTFMAVGVYLITGAVYVLALIGILLVLLVPYIMHYYLLENETQRMYEQYDKMLEYKKKREEDWADIED